MSRPSPAATSASLRWLASASLAAHAVLLARGASALSTERCDRRLRIELEAAPRDGDLVAVLERGERGLEAALADVAPGAGDVRPDLDVHGRPRR